MKPQIKSWWVTGLTAITATLVVSQFAMAGSAGGTGIVINQANSSPVGDPIFEYYLQISVYATSSDPLVQNGYITVSGFTDLASFAGAGEPSGWTSYINVGTETVTFTYTGSTSITTTTNYPLGDFYVGPTIELNAAPTPTLTYTAYLNPNGPPSNSGTIVVNYVVPEPSSAILLVAGLGAAIPLFQVCNKRRQGHKPSKGI